MQAYTVPKLKYHIMTLLSALPIERRLEIKEFITRERNISHNTYSRYINLRNTDSNDIPAQVLLDFANQLNVPIEDLFNN